MSGTWHPDGCRCSGCRQPALRTPARTSRPAASQPVYRRPRSHAYSCRCPRCVQATRHGNEMLKTDGAILGVLLAAAAIAGICGWAARNGRALLEALPFIGGAALVICAVAFFNRRERRRRGAQQAP